ncbi:MAG: protein serine/threonine phosphatase 2C family protein [Chlamydiales bacterium]|nr:protein serine/threonine phosphatase 2C family protein [Chlamydiales bacterium]
MTHIQKNLISIAASTLAGGIASYYTTHSFRSGFSMGFLNATIACTLNETWNKESNRYKRVELTVKALLLTSLFECTIAPRLFGRTQLLLAKNLLPPLLFSAAIGSLPFLTLSEPLPPKEDVPNSPSPVTREKPEAYPLGEAPHWHKSKHRTESPHLPEVRMKRNLEKAIAEHRTETPEDPYVTVEMIRDPTPPLASLVLSHGSHAIQGGRDVMEDEHFYLENDASILTGVFDGHGGQGVATHAKIEVPNLFFDILKEQKGDIVKTFEALCERVHESSPKERGGTTAVICYVDKQTGIVYTATLADAEANIYREIAGKMRSIPLSPIRDWKTDRKFIDTKEYPIYAIGRKPRLMGDLNVSRALGDKQYPPISQKPKVTQCQMLPGDVLILCCDGLKDFVEERAICEKVTEHKSSSEEVLAQALTQASYDKQSYYTGGDNVSVVVVRAK